MNTNIESQGVFLVGTLPGTRRPNPDFLARNVIGEPRAIGQLEIVATPEYIENGFPAYRAHISSFMVATDTQTQMLTNTTGYDWEPSTENRIPFPLPGVAFRIARTILNEERILYYQEQGSMVIVSTGGQNIDVVFKRPKDDLFESFVDEAKVSGTRFNIGNDRQSMSMFGYRTFAMTLDIVSLFLRTRMIGFISHLSGTDALCRHLPSLAVVPLDLGVKSVSK